jgi:outer membrane protein assembly factor BamB
MNSIPIIPPPGPIFYFLLVLAFLVLALVLFLVASVTYSRPALRIKVLFLRVACFLMMILAYPLYVYGTKPAPLPYSTVLIGLGQGSQLVALNACDGTALWTHQVSPTPSGRALASVGSDHLVYAVSSVNERAGVVTAYAMSDGRPVWQSAIPLPPVSQGDVATFSQLLVSDGRVYVVESLGPPSQLGPNYIVYALCPNDGQLVWKYRAQNLITPSLFLTAGDGLLLIQGQDGGILANSSSGRLQAR